MANVYTVHLFIVGFFMGVGFVSVVQISKSTIYVTFIIFFACCASWGNYIFRTIRSRSIGTYPLGFCVLVFGLAFVFGMVRVASALDNEQAYALDGMLGKQVILHGLITEEPEPREKGRRMVVDVFNKERKVVTRVITTADFYPIFNYGDEVVLKGVLQKPEVIESDLGKDFNYPGYLAKSGIFYILEKPKVELKARNEGVWIKEKLFSFKNAFLKNIHNAVPDPEASLAGGLVVGAKTSLGKKLEDDFRRTGIVHIVVLSGFNITIVAVAIMKVLSFLPQRLSAVFGVTGLVLFAILTGGTATVVRSTIMTFIAIVGTLARRDYDVLRGLCTAGFCMVLQNPLILMFDPSFELSFLATLGLILVSPFITPLVYFIPEKFGLREIAVATISTQIFVLPYLLYQMGTLSIVGLFVNFLILPIIPLTMLLVFLTGSLGFFVPFLAQICGYLSYALLSYELKVVDVFARLTFAAVTISYFPLWLLAVSYAFFAIVLVRLYRRQSKDANMLQIKQKASS